MPDRVTSSIPSHIMRHAAGALVAVSLLVGGAASGTFAAPQDSAVLSVVPSQNVDWMSPDTAATLDIGMDVMVPSWIPDPFSGMAPSVTATGGYYQLYWMIPGGSPTFLYIEGTVGGGFPAGSPADLNKQLTVNASVQGWSAIHDVGIPAGSETPIYDQVWWIANGVLYTVSSNNMTGTDTLSLAESLIVLQQPAAPVEEPELPTEPPYVPPEETVTTDEESEPVVDEPVVEDSTTDTTAAPQDPVTDTTTQGSGTDSTTQGGESDSMETSTDTASSTEGSTNGTGGSSSTGTESESDNSGTTSGSGNAGPWSPGRYEQGVPSDGTGGPLPPLIGGDGTGGPNDLILPRILFMP